MKGPDENPMEEFHQMTIEVLQKCYHFLSVEDLATLCVATGVKPEDAFPWHNERKAA